MTRRVIIHADDFGLHPAVNKAVARGHAQGMVSSASLLVNGDAAAEAVQIARALPGLDLGLHFTLTGQNGGLWRFLRNSGNGTLTNADVERTLRHQLDAAIHGYRLSLSHIDSHQHLHALPFLCRMVCRVAKEYGIRCVRIPEDGPAFAAVPSARHAQAAVLRVFARLARRIVARHGLQTTDSFAGMAVSGHLTAPTLAQYIRNAKPGTTEIVVHPGADNRALSAQFAWGFDWQGELSAVQSEEARAAFTGVQLVGWRDL